MAAENGSAARATLLESSKYPRLIPFSTAFSAKRRSLSADHRVRQSGNAESRARGRARGSRRSKSAGSKKIIIRRVGAVMRKTATETSSEAAGQPENYGTLVHVLVIVCSLARSFVRPQSGFIPRNYRGKGPP